MLRSSDQSFCSTSTVSLPGSSSQLPKKLALLPA
jgi:hypothetical protein